MVIDCVGAFLLLIARTLRPGEGDLLVKPNAPKRGTKGLRWVGAVLRARITMTSTTELKNSIQMKLEQTGEYDR